MTTPEIAETIAFAGTMIHLTFEPDPFGGFWGYIIPGDTTVRPCYRHKAICRDDAIARVKEHCPSVSPRTTWYTI